MNGRWNRRWLLGILVLTIALLVFFSVKYFYHSPEIREIYMDFSVGDHVGVNVDTDAFHFGTVKQGSAYRLQREMVIGNKQEFPRTVKIKVKGDITSLVSLSPSIFVLAPGEDRTVNVTLTTIPTLPMGNYTGILRATLYDD